MTPLPKLTIEQIMILALADAIIWKRPVTVLEVDGERVRLTMHV
jgi:hypothetical protein